MAEPADGFPAMAALFVSLSSGLYCLTLTMMQRGNNINSNGSPKIHNLNSFSLGGLVVFSYQKNLHAWFMALALSLGLDNKYTSNNGNDTFTCLISM